MVASKLDNVLVAISDPTRRSIMGRLARGPARSSDGAAPSSMSLTGVCKHVRILEKAALVRRTRQGRENVLHLTPEPLRDVARWITTYERFWNERLDQLETFFTTKQEKQK